jgi:uncharacterized protein (TIGR02145 family)
MLNNLTNFFNIITERRIKKTLEPSDLVAIGTRQSKSIGDYKPTAIQFSDLQTQLGGDINLTVTGTSGPATFIDGVLNIPDYSDADPKVYRAKITAETVDWPGYGFLYNWYAVSDVRKLENPSGGTGLTAPNLWRVPSNADWDTLTIFAGGTSVGGGKLKSTLTSTGFPFLGWANIHGGGTDDYNFNAVPGGIRGNVGNYFNLPFQNIFWTFDSFRIVLSNTNSEILNETAFSNSLKSQGYSVRLVREATAGELLLNDGDTSDTSSLDPYTGNNGTTYVTVKIGTQIWLAQNLRETKYNDNSDIFNAAPFYLFPGGDGSNPTWVAKGTAQEGAWTVYIYNSGDTTYSLDYTPTTISNIYPTVLENTLGASVNWESIVDGTNTVYRTVLSTSRNWYSTHIKLTQGYDVSDYSNTVPSIVQKNLIIKRAVTGENYIDFFPVTIDSTGVLTIEPLNNYSDLLGSPDSSVYLEILEYQPLYYGSGLSAGIGISNL